MNAKQLKDSILQYAMQGKLVPQNANDEPAFELLERIKNEKEQLVRDNIIKKEKAIPEVVEEEVPFDIPDSWEWVRLGNVTFKINDGTHNTPNYTEKGVPFLSVKDMSSGKLSFENTKFISKEEHDILYKRCNPEYGDILLTKVGTTGIPVIVDTHTEFSLFVSVALIKFSQQNIYNKFLYYALQSPIVFKQSKEGTKGVGNKNLVVRVIKNFYLPLPPLEEQKRIVRKIEELMKKVYKYSYLYEQQQSIRKTFPTHIEKSILQYAVQGKLVPQDTNDEPAYQLVERIKEEKQKLIKNNVIKKEKALPKIEEDEIPFDIPSTWEWVRVRDIYYNNGQKKPDVQFTYIDVSSIDSQNGCISDDIRVLEANNAPSRARKIVEVGDIIYSTVRPYLKNIAIINKNYDNETIASTAFVVMKPILIYNRYLYYVLRSPMFDLQVSSNSKGVAYPAINDNNFNKLIIPIPPLKEQKHIVKKIEELLSIRNKLVKI